MEDSVIIELRGNGVVLTTYEIQPELLKLLHEKATIFGEPLEIAWFDPFFWHPREMQELKFAISKNTKEYRGLLNDDISFMEIRRKGKKRKKYLVKELLGEEQLFPVIRIVNLCHTGPFGRKVVIYQSVFGSGCLARFELLNEIWDLSMLEASLISYQTVPNQTLLFTSCKSGFMSSKYDDFVLRGGVMEILEG